MEQALCKLTLVYPPAGNDRIVELMLDVEPPIAGFTTWLGEGHGFGFANASTSERVRGRVKRTILVAVLAKENIAPLLALIAERAPLPHLTYWVERVEDFGQLHRWKAGRNSTLTVSHDTKPPEEES